jgi:hypothetical protein
MKKNVAGQAIGAQLVSATDGSNVTSGTTTVYRTGDNGTQASIGTATHKGQGYWSIALSQANTNFDHAAFTFVNTNAVSATVQVFTSFPQSRDLSSDVTAILADTNELQGNQGDWATATGFATVNPDNASIAAILTDTGTTIPAQISALNNFDPATDTVANVTNVANITSTVVANFVQCKGTPLTNDQRDTFLTFIDEVGSTVGIGDLMLTASYTTPPTTAEIEAALINEGDGQQLIDAIVTVINTSLDIPSLELAAIASAVRTELSTELGRLDATISSRLATSGYTAPANSDILAIKNKTDDLTFTKVNELDVNIQSVNDVTVNGNGTTGNEWGP